MNSPKLAQPSGEVPIKVEGDIVIARRAVRDAAASFGFTPADVARIVTAASELARNIYRYAGEGVMQWNCVERPGAHIEIRFVDQGPGIADIPRALKEGFSTGGGLGMGLPGAKRLADEMDIESAPGQGTIITLRKWRKT